MLRTDQDAVQVDIPQNIPSAKSLVAFASEIPLICSSAFRGLSIINLRPLLGVFETYV